MEVQSNSKAGNVSPALGLSHPNQEILNKTPEKESVPRDYNAISERLTQEVFYSPLIETQVFAKSGKIQRSPTEEDSRMKKRKREYGVVVLKSPPLAKARGKLGEKIKKLQEIVKLTTNTKVEIKKLVEEVGTYYEKMKRIEEEEEKTVFSQARGLTYEEEMSSKMSSTQNNCDKNDGKEDDKYRKGSLCKRCGEVMEKDREEEDTEEIHKWIDSYDEASVDEGIMEDMIGKEWKEQVYRKVNETSESPIWRKYEDEHDLLVIMDDWKQESSILEAVSQRHPEIEDIYGEKPEGMMDMEYVEKLVFRKGGEKKRQGIFLIKAKKDMSKLRFLLNEMAEEVQKTGERDISVVATETYCLGVIRKILELTTVKMKGNVELFVPKARNVGKRVRRKGKEKETDAIIVKTEGETFADVLKAVKEKIKPDEIGAEVQELRKTRNGDLLIVTKKGTADGLKNEIRRNFGAAAVDPKSDRIELYVRDVEETLPEEEIKEGILKELGEGTDWKFEIRSSKTGRRGLKGITIAADRKTTKALVEKGRIKLGWFNCDIRPKVRIERCLDCLRIGHSKLECPEEGRRERRCLNCTEKGHNIKDCQRPKFCNMCSKTGHRADTALCPAYRKLLGERIEAEKSKWLG